MQISRKSRTWSVGAPNRDRFPSLFLVTQKIISDGTRKTTALSPTESIVFATMISLTSQISDTTITPLLLSITSPRRLIRSIYRETHTKLTTLKTSKIQEKKKKKKTNCTTNPAVFLRVRLSRIMTTCRRALTHPLRDICFTLTNIYHPNPFMPADDLNGRDFFSARTC